MARAFYAPEVENKEAIFSLFVKAITAELTHKLCLFIEISDLSSKMFGYGKLRENGFFPIQWQKIHNSLHSKHPYERLPQKLRDKIAVAEQRGVKAATIESEGKELQQAVKLMRHYFRLNLDAPCVAASSSKTWQQASIARYSQQNTETVLSAHAFASSSAATPTCGSWLRAARVS